MVLAEVQGDVPADHLVDYRRRNGRLDAAPDGTQAGLR